MITCPSCGIENPDTRIFCAVCGTRLQEDLPVPDVVQEEVPPPAPAAKKPALPSWLQGAELELEPPPVAPVVPSFPSSDSRRATPPPAATSEWDDKLDFSDLPDWEVDEPASPSSTPIEPPVAEPTAPPVEDEPVYGDGEGSGLLTGVRGPIPIEPIVTIAHRPPEFPSLIEDDLTDESQAEANLFAQIAGGAVRPEPITVQRPTLRGAGLLYLLLALVVAIPLALDLIVFDLPKPRASVDAFAQTLADLPSDGTVLVAVDYDGGVQDELSPALTATLTQLRRTIPDGDIIAVSTSPFGAALAEAAWGESQGDEGVSWDNRGFISGGTSGQRTLLSSTPADLVIVVADTGRVGSWVEQETALDTPYPMLAIVPATAETMLSPYLASGQINGALMSLNDTATYESSTLGLRRRDSTGWHRLDAATLAAATMIGVMLLGSVVGVFTRQK